MVGGSDTLLHGPDLSMVFVLGSLPGVAGALSRRQRDRVLGGESCFSTVISKITFAGYNPLDSTLNKHKLLSRHLDLLLYSSVTCGFLVDLLSV